MDSENDVFLTEGFVPDLETLKDARPKLPWFYRNARFNFSSRFDALAWTLSAYARRWAYYRCHEFGGEQAIRDLPFETWLLGSPISKSDSLAYWFRNETHESNYRIIIHRAPRHFSGQKIPLIWHRFYDILKNKYRKQIPLRHKIPEKGELRRLKMITSPFLEELVHAYRTGRNEAEKLIQQTGHPYCFSLGLPNL